MIRLENLSLIFAAGTPDENEALKNISLTVNPGDFITIIGSNGAGKTTLYNAIAGTYPLHAGRIFIRGEGLIPRPLGRSKKGIKPESKTIREQHTPPGLWPDFRAGLLISGPGNAEREITREPEYRRARYIGRIFQNPLLGTAGRMSLEDNMVISCRKGYRGLTISLNRELRERFRTELAALDMGLENRLGDNVELFSGGQRQALTLLMTVMSRPSLLLLDEHTAALDPHNAELVMKLTTRFAKDYGLTVMMITHNMKDALETGNRLLMMDGGEIIMDAGAEEKAKLTTTGIVRRFKDIKHKELASDEMLLET